MVFSRQFRALGRVAAFFGISWGIVGTAVDMLLGGPLVGSLLHFGVLFGTAGAISGILTGVVLGRAEAGRSVGDLPIWRSVLWGFTAGVGPAVVMIGILAALGPTPGVIVPLLGLGWVTGGLSAGVAAWVSHEARRSDLLRAASETKTLNQ
jgi:hypothetical protein